MISASDTSGIVPFTVRFDGGDSSDPEGDSLSYRWDLDGDGSYDDSKSSTPTRTFTDPGAHLVRLKVADGRGGVDADRLTIMAGPQPVGASFSDVPVGYVFYEDIEWLLAEGITEGCDPEGTMFCPTEPVTRGQMAAFLVRYLGLTDPGPGDWFVDDDGSLFESEIDRLAQAGITLGCNPPANDRFCPLESVTRGQMATFLDRALDLPAGALVRVHRHRQLGAPRRDQQLGRRRDHPRLHRHLVLPRTAGDPRPDGGIPPPRRRVPLNPSNPGSERVRRTHALPSPGLAATPGYSPTQG